MILSLLQSLFGKSKPDEPLLNRHRLISQLEKIEYTEGSIDAKDDFEKLNLADTLLLLAQVSHESEYQLCGDVTEHLLGTRPGPVDAEDEL